MYKGISKVKDFRVYTKSLELLQALLPGSHKGFALDLQGVITVPPSKKTPAEISLHKKSLDITARLVLLVAT